MANAYLVAGGNGLINDSSNWSTTSGGVAGYTPINTDDLIIDANSMNAPLITRAATYNSITFSNYTGLFTLTQNISLNSSIEYSVGMTTTGTATVAVGSTILPTATINFNGVTHSGTFSFNNGSNSNTIYTIIGDMNVIGTVSFTNSSSSGSGAKATINGGDILCNSGFGIYGNGNRWINGTSTIRFVGSGTGNFTSGVSAFIFVPIVFQKTGGSVTMTSGSLYPRNSSITWLSGIFNNFTLSINVGFCTLDTQGGIPWSSIVIVGSGSLTNNSLCVCTGTFTNSISSSIGGNGNFNLYNLTSTNSLGWNAGVVINVSNMLTSIDTAASPSLFASNTLGQQAYLILDNSGDQDVAHTNARDINSNGGQTIYSYRTSSLINTNNWATLPIITSINTNTILR